MRQESMLIEAARQGDHAAVLRLLAKCQPDLRRIARSQCATSSDADDATQETLWLIYQRIGALRTLASFSSWMFSIVRRECQRLLRKALPVANNIEVDSPDFRYRAETELRSDLVDAILSLPPKYRQAILLRDYEERSISEIADQLQLTRAAVKSRIHRGRQMIREYLVD